MNRVPTYSLGAAEVLAQNSYALNYNGFAPTYKQLSDYSHLIDNHVGTKQYLGDLSLASVLKTMAEFANRHSAQVAKLAKHLYTGNVKQDAFHVWHFIKTNIKYAYDQPGQEELRTPARTWADRYTGVDCDDYSIFAASLLKEMGYKPFFKTVSFINRPNRFQHVYVTVNDIVIDAVLNSFNVEPKNIAKEMKTYGLAGTDGLGNIDVAALVQGAGGLVSSIGAAVPPPAGSIMGAVGGVASAIAALFRKNTITEKEVQELGEKAVKAADDVVKNMKDFDPDSFGETSKALIAIRRGFVEAVHKLAKQKGGGIPPKQMELFRSLQSEIGKREEIASQAFQKIFQRGRELEEAFLNSIRAWLQNPNNNTVAAVAAARKDLRDWGKGRREPFINANKAIDGENAIPATKEALQAKNDPNSKARGKLGYALGTFDRGALNPRLQPLYDAVIAFVPGSNVPAPANSGGTVNTGGNTSPSNNTNNNIDNPNTAGMNKWVIGGVALGVGALIISNLKK